MKKTSSGISFIEVMTATVVISIACVGLMMGVVHARGELHSLEIKERATEELLNYMEFWKGRVADGRLSPSERAGDERSRIKPQHRARIIWALKSGTTWGQVK